MQRGQRWRESWGRVDDVHVAKSRRHVIEAISIGPSTDRGLLLGLSGSRLAERDRSAELGLLPPLDEQALMLVDEHPQAVLERVALQAQVGDRRLDEPRLAARLLHDRLRLPARLAHDELPLPPRVLLHLLGEVAQREDRLLDLLLADLGLLDPRLEGLDLLLEEIPLGDEGRRVLGERRQEGLHLGPIVAPHGALELLVFDVDGSESHPRLRGRTLLPAVSLGKQTRTSWPRPQGPACGLLSAQPRAPKIARPTRTSVAPSS